MITGRYVYYGIREFGMAAAMNGMALHGGIIPYGGTFLVFSDYMPQRHPHVGAAAGSRHLCADARLDRSG
jgi:transketolase